MEKPILFNTDMVKAILNGSKTQTRRLPSSRIRDKWLSWDEYQCAVAPPGSILATEDGFYKHYPPYKEGDILYVRETWKQATGGTAGPGLFDTILYKADEPQDTTGLMVEERWHPSIHMPKSDARIWLLVKAVRLERLQNIDEDGVVAEGAESLIRGCEHMDYSVIPPESCFNTHACKDCIINKGYPELFGKMVWDKTVNPDELALYGWDANPYVWVVEFERMTKRQMLAYANRDAAKYADSDVLLPAT